MKNPLGISDSLHTNFYKYPSLPPPMPWLDSIAPNQPKNLVAQPNALGVNLQWQTPAMAADSEEVYGYVIYRFNSDELVNLADPKNILHIQYSANTQYEDQNADKNRTYLYVVTAIDRLKNESGPTPTVKVIATTTGK